MAKMPGLLSIPGGVGAKAPESDAAELYPTVSQEFEPEPPKKKKKPFSAGVKGAAFAPKATLAFPKSRE